MTLHGREPSSITEAPNNPIQPTEDTRHQETQPGSIRRSQVVPLRPPLLPPKHQTNPLRRRNRNRQHKRRGDRAEAADPVDDGLPFDVSRAFDEAGGIAHPRIWTAQRDRDMWAALQG